MRTLTEVVARERLAAWGVSLNRWQFAGDVEAAVQAAKRIGFPVALKIVSPEVIHKSDVGGVSLGIASEDGVRGAFAKMVAGVGQAKPGAEIQGVVVSEMVAGIAEVFVGMKLDPTFGWVCALGLGGVWVEVMRDVSLRICPFDEAEASAMLADLRGAALLRGYRGRPAADVAALGRLVANLSQALPAKAGDVRELDLNPVIVGPEGAGAVAVDARLAIGA